MGPARPGWAARAQLPAFPWDQLAPYAQTAREHPGGIVDLSIGTPVDPTPPLVQQALAAAADAPGYPLTIGTPALRAALVDWSARRLGARVTEAQVLPSIGSKELVALLPSLLGLEPGSEVLLPALAYPTYDVGVRLAGCVPVAIDDPLEADPARVSLVWVNSPSQPDRPGAPARAAARARRVGPRARRAGRQRRVLPRAGLDRRARVGAAPRRLRRVDRGPARRALAVQAQQPRGLPRRLRRRRRVRRRGPHRGAQAPRAARARRRCRRPSWPRSATTAHVAEQRARYAARREVLLPAVLAAGLRVEHSEAGLYLWATRDEACWDTVAALARIGVLVAPGAFYGGRGRAPRAAGAHRDRRAGRRPRRSA